MTSYLRENEAENLQNGDVHLAQIPDFNCGRYTTKEKSRLKCDTVTCHNIYTILLYFF